MGRLLGYTFCAVLSLMLLAAPIVVAGGGCINRNAANDGAIATVQIKDCSFAPTITRVPVDAAVTWKNVDYLPHVISGVGWGSAEGYASYGLSEERKRHHFRGLLGELARRYPQMHVRICDERGEPRPHINVFVNDDHFRARAGLDTPLAAGDLVTILPAVSGG